MRCDYSDWCIGESAVDDNNGSHTLSSSATIGHIKAHRAVAHCKALVGEAPVPDLVDSCESIGDLQIPDRELLVADIHPVFASVNYEIIDKATRTCNRVSAAVKSRHVKRRRAIMMNNVKYWETEAVQMVDGLKSCDAFT